MTSLREMARALGGDVMKSPKGGPSYILCPGPAHSARDRSLSVTPVSTAPDGFIVHSFANNDWRACRAHVLARLGKPGEWHQARPMLRTDNSVAAAALWKAGLEPRGTIVENYLRGRGLDLPADIAMRVVRFHPTCPWRGEDGTREQRLVMLTAFRSIADDKLVAIHRTLLSRDGRKLDRRMLGPVGGAALKIDADEDVEQGLIIGEGFETCLSARMLGFRPVWALGSAGAIANFPILSGIDAITILAETDDNGANAKGTKACGNRWAAAGREVIIATPYIRGDMNDALRSMP